MRTLLLTSSRADPHRSPDLLSDYDVEVFVDDIEPFREDDTWLAPFGPVMVRWPAKPGPTGSDGWITQLVLFEDGVRIDFQITALPPAESENLDTGYRVLIDKDGRAQQLPPPTHTKYLITPPTAEAFASRINAFWWDIVYVAKALHRGELNYARYMLDSTIRYRKLQPVMEWYIGLQENWSVSTGLYGRWFQHYLDEATWHDYLQTFAGAEIEDNWRALFATLDFFGHLARQVAVRLAFDYPEATDRKVTRYIHWIKNIESHQPRDNKH